MKPLSWMVMSLYAIQGLYAMEPIALDVQKKAAQDFVKKHKEQIAEFSYIFTKILCLKLKEMKSVEEKSGDVCAALVNRTLGLEFNSESHEEELFQAPALQSLWRDFTSSVPGMAVPDLKPGRTMLANLQNFCRAVLRKIEELK